MEKQSWMNRLAKWSSLRGARLFTVVLLTTTLLALFTQMAQASTLTQESPPNMAVCGISRHSSLGGESAAPTQDHNFVVYNDPAWSGHPCYSDTPMSANIAAGCNDQTSSVYLASGWSVRLYDGQNQSGSSVCFNRSYENLAQHTYDNNAAMDNTISSFTLHNGAWCGSSPSPAYPLEVYNDANYAGHWCYSAQAESANIADGCNDLITSILLRPGWSIRVYEGTNQSGSSQCLNSSDADLRDNFFVDGSPMSDAISSFHLYNQAYCGETSLAEPVERPEPPDGGSCPVPFFWQGNPSWGGNRFGVCTCTIGKCGCALTSVAMTFKYYGVNHNPGSLATCLGKNACPMGWSSACSGGKVSFKGATGFSWNRLAQEIANGQLVILRLDKPGTMHYVVVVSGSGNNAQNYLVNDPGILGGTRIRLSAVLARGYKLGSGSTALRIWSGTPDCQTANSRNDLTLLAPSLPLSTTQPITGAVILYHNTETTMTLALTAESINGNVVDMLIWTDSISNTIWQPFSAYVALPLSGQFFVQFRDDVGTTSTIISGSITDDFSESISGPDLYSVFLPLILREQ